MRSNEEYRRHSGDCPRCHTHEVDWDSIDIEGNEVTQRAICLVCGLSWVAVYKLAGYELVLTAKGDAT